ncbi:MAG: glycine cleavage system aminomethyltransferase GcvT, partial [Thermoanaerobaculia bacterium]
MSTTKAARKTPLHDCHLEAGARMVEFAGWRMPVQYSGVIDEHRAVRAAAGLFDVSHMGEIRVAGPGAEAALERLTPNNVARLKPGRAHYSALLTERGTYVDDLLVYRLSDDRFLLVVNAANAARDLEWVRTRVAGDAEVDDVSDSYALLALQGPRAPEILAGLTDLDLGALKYYRFADGEVNGCRMIVSRTGYTGEDGFELYTAPADAAAL